jgi:hypothetical protein
MGYNIKQIELAFFNHDSDGSEVPDEDWQKRRKEWASFYSFLRDDSHPELSVEKPNDELGIIGLKESDAKKKVEDKGKMFRVTCRDNEPLVCTMDYQTNRVNVSVDDGIVVFRSNNG